ncbi:MAG: NAD(P)/FAD-dependent oxidoreductase [Cyclobacteriaceae bacterium]
MEKVVIIGNGISGVTAARHIRKLSEKRIVVISSETKHFFSRTALMYIYMGHMKFEHTKPYEDWFWEKNNIDLVQAFVKEVDTGQKALLLADGDEIHYDQLILAVGSKSNKFGWPGQDLDGVQGLYSYPDLELMEKYTMDIDRAVIIGGGLIGIEMAEMLLTRNIPVSMLIREKEFWDNVLPQEEASLVSRHVLEHHIDLRKETELKEILSDRDGRVMGVVTKDDERIDCQFVGLTVGVSPNIQFLEESAIETDRGVLVNECLETNIPDVYAIGDCAQFKTPLPNRRPIEQVWYTGRMQGEVVARTICEQKTAYKPGIWFNSAKFLDIEYQTYGHVWNQLRDDEVQFYWEHPKGKLCVKMVYHETTRKFLGINSFGIRWRHESFDQWLKDKRSIDYVLEHLSTANFDPEFFRHHEPAIIQAYNQQNPDHQVVPKKRGIFQRLFA